MPLTRFVNNCVASKGNVVEFSTLLLFDIKRSDFDRRSDDGKLYKNAPRFYVN